jgi:8-oxo-dGTP pyrophosphatase MutT (NUDIX family)
MSSRKSTHKIPDQKPEPDPYKLSHLSTTAVLPTRWASRDFVIAAGLCILQPSTGCVVLLSIGDQEAKGGHWFLPRGRKDIGESLEATALREGYEVSSYSFPTSQKVN